MESGLKNTHSLIFREYPDVLDVQQVSRLLNVSTKTVYGLLREGGLTSLKVGRAYRIPKITLMKFMKVWENPHQIMTH